MPVEGSLPLGMDASTLAVALTESECACRGLLLERMGQPDEARADLEAACSLEPDSAEYARSCGMAHRAAGRLAEALAGFERVLALVPNDPAALSNRGCVLLCLQPQHDRKLCPPASCMRGCVHGKSSRHTEKSGR